MAGYTTPTPNTRRIEISPCGLCCCECRSFFGRGQTHVTLELLTLTSRIEEVDDVELIPNSLSGTWVPVADFFYDASGHGCGWELDWLSPNVVFAGVSMPSLVTPAEDWFTRYFKPNGSFEWPWAWHYVFTDTRPKNATHGNIERFSGVAGVNLAWDGAEFDAVQLVSYMTTFTVAEPGLGIAGTGPTSGVYTPAPIENTFLYGFSGFPRHSGPILASGTVPFMTPHDARLGNNWCCRSAQVFFPLFGDDYPRNSMTWAADAADMTLDEAVSSRRHVYFRVRLGTHTTPETVPACKCIPAAGGENTLRVTFTPARPGDGVWTPFAQTAEPDHNVGNFSPMAAEPLIFGAGLIGVSPGTPFNPYPIRSSAWRKVMGLPPYYWTLTEAGAGSVGGFIGPLFGDSANPTGGAVLPGILTDKEARCMVLTQLAAGTYTIAGHTHQSFESPLELRFKTSSTFNGSSVDALPVTVAGSGVPRQLRVHAIEGAASAQPIAPAGATGQYSLVGVERQTAGYFGIGPSRINAAGAAGTAQAAGIPVVAANLTTGEAGDGVYWTSWTNTLSPAGKYDGTFIFLSLKKVTVTNLATGDEAVFEYTHTNSSILVGHNAGWGTVDIYGFTHVFGLTANDFGPTGGISVALPYGRYTIEAEIFGNDNVDSVGALTRTNWFLNLADSFDHGTFFFANKPKRTWNGFYNAGGAFYALTEI
jgi:hypothetical protein